MAARVRTACHMRAALEGFVPLARRFVLPGFRSPGRRLSGAAAGRRNFGTWGKTIRKRVIGMIYPNGEPALTDADYVIASNAEETLESMRKLVDILRDQVQDTRGGGTPLPGGTCSQNYRQSSFLLITEFCSRMEEILAGRAPEGTISQLARSVAGDCVFTMGVFTALHYFLLTFPPKGGGSRDETPAQ